MVDKLLVGLKPLNPKDFKTRLKRTSILLPSEEYFVQLFSDNIFRNISKTDATKDDGMNAVAKYYQVEQHWNNYTNTSSIRIQCTRPEKKINLLLIFKTKSEVDSI